MFTILVTVIKKRKHFSLASAHIIRIDFSVSRLVCLVYDLVSIMCMIRMYHGGRNFPGLFDFPCFKFCCKTRKFDMQK